MLALVQPSEDWFASYLNAGLSVIPIDPRIRHRKDDLKKPHVALTQGTWHQFMARLATPEETRDWVGSGVGIVCGAVSGNLFVYDVDYLPFCDWLEEHYTDRLLKKTWTVRSGSGKLHIYLRTHEEQGSTYYAFGGVKLGDARGRGEMVVAPPSPHISGGTYTTLYGSPDTIATVPDALRLTRALAERFHQHRTGSVLAPKIEQRILPAVSGDTADRLVKQLRDVQPRIKRAVLQGAVAGDGEWVNSESQSQIDYAVCCELVRHNWTDDQIETAFATFPIGAATYRNTERPNHGSKYLLYTIQKARGEAEKAVVASREAKGVGWVITEARVVTYDEPEWTLTFTTDDGNTYVATIRHDDLLTDKRFIGAVSKSCFWWPTLYHHHRGRGIEDLGKAILAMATVEKVATEATLGGHMRDIVKRVVRQSCKPMTPATTGDYGLGWRDDDWVYVRPTILVERVQSFKRTATVESIAGVVKSLQGEIKVIHIGDARERMWTIPAEVVS